MEILITIVLMVIAMRLAISIHREFERFETNYKLRKTLRKEDRL